MRISSKTLYCYIFLFLISCNAVSQNKKQTARIIKNLGIPPIEKVDILNSKYREVNISVSPDNKYLFFESERPSSWSTKSTQDGVERYDQDIWYSVKVSDKWQKPKNPGRTINSPSGEGEPNISPDGQTIYFQSFKTGWENDGGPYYKAELKGEEWINPVGFGGAINQFFKKNSSLEGRITTMGTDGSTFSPDGKKMIFAFGLDYYGNLDIYMSKKDNDGNWSAPEKQSISTPFNDRCPFLAADGKTLYFASNGYSGFGKLDIYKTTLNDDDTWGEVINLGEPFNTKDDDYSFVLTSNGDDVYFVRNGDIQYVNMKNISSEIKPSHTLILKGIVRDSITKQPLEAVVRVSDLEGKDIGNSRSNSRSGAYTIVVIGGKNYNLFAEKENYKAYNRNFITASGLNEKELNMDIDLSKFIRDSIPEIIKPPDTVKSPVIVSKPQDTLIPAPQCESRLDGLKYSIGINPAYPYAIGFKGEIIYNNFSFMLGGMYLPNVGEYDDPKPPDNLMSDNYSTSFIFTGVYNFTSFGCRFYPLAGVFSVIKTRTWKKPILNSADIRSGNYTDHPYGALIGAKLFFYDNFYIEGALGFGKFAYHDLISGEITKHEFKSIPWFAICYLF